MSLFKKPTKKIQRRVFGAGDDDEDEAPEAPPPPIISKMKINLKPVKNTPLLSFADEEEETEVFKVKKSSQSKRLSKKRDKTKKKGFEDDKQSENNIEEIQSNATNPDNDNDTKPKKKKKVTLEGLILSGREALAADGAGDVSDDGDDAREEEEEGGFHRYRAESVRAALAAGDGIPDAALIHAARKSRQQARELGGGDFIPVSSETAPGSRLVRDDDGSGDDEEEGRLLVRGLELPSDKPQRGTAAETSDVEMDSEGEQWEEQQMQKAVPAILDVTGEGMEMNPFAVAPPPPRLADAPPHLRPLAPSDRHPTTPTALLHALAERLESLKLARAETSKRRADVEDRLLAAARVREQCKSKERPLDVAYKRAQATRGYITDLLECLDEKMPALEKLEARAVSVRRRRRLTVAERRRLDVRDQARDLHALAKRVGGGALARGGAGAGADAGEAEAAVRRAAEREGRRRARRLQREAGAGGAAHLDGDSSDDDLPPAEHHALATEIEEIRRESSALFADTLPAFRSARGVASRLARARRTQQALYRDSYLGECAPRLLAPYVRHEMILWNPLGDEDNEDYERMEWYKCAMMYGVKSERLTSDSEESDEEKEAPVKITMDSVRDDPDLMLVPTLVNMVVVPKLTELVREAWEPMSMRGSMRLRLLLLRAGGTTGAGGTAGAGAGPLRALAGAVAERLRDAAHHDLYIPPLPPAVSESGGVFWRRALGAACRLLRAALALCTPPPLHAHALALQILEAACLGAGAAPGPQAAWAGAALAGCVPRAPPALRRAALQRLARLAAAAMRNLHSDNPLHLKALEQVRGVLAEARAAEEALEKEQQNEDFL